MSNFGRFSGIPKFEPYVKDGSIQPGEFVICEDWWYDHPSGRILICKDFVTDFASTPQALHAFAAFDPLKEAIYAALPHDALYCLQDRARADADQILHDAMIDSGCSRALAVMYYAGVRAFGWIPWDKRLRQGGGIQPDDFATREAYERARLSRQ